MGDVHHFTIKMEAKNYRYKKLISFQMTTATIKEVLQQMWNRQSKVAIKQKAFFVKLCYIQPATGKNQRLSGLHYIYTFIAIIPAYTDSNALQTYVMDSLVQEWA